MSADLYAVIMAGGSGTRFWPASRSARPKQFLPISGRHSMIAETYGRLEGLVPREQRLVVTAESQVELVLRALPELPPENVLAEPEARNTGPCVALAAFQVAARSPEAVQIVLPADHVIEPAESFRATLAAAADEARRGDCLCTLGIRPTHPATGYGYIDAGEILHETNGVPVHAVTRFVEKPDEDQARVFLETGRFFWNAGIFVWSTPAILAALEAHFPEAHAGLTRVRQGALLPEVYAGLPRLPIDVAVMERAGNVRMLPVDYRWSDVGSWAALPEVAPEDGQGNVPVLSGGARLLAEDSSGCVAYAEGDHVIALVGVHDLVIVRTPDATLVCPRERAQDVRRIVERLRDEAPGFL